MAPARTRKNPPRSVAATAARRAGKEKYQGVLITFTGRLASFPSRHDLRCRATFTRMSLRLLSGFQSEKGKAASAWDGKIDASRAAERRGAGIARLKATEGSTS